MYPDVEKQVTYLIVPFAFKLPFEMALDKLKTEIITGTDKKIWQGKDLPKKRLFQHIDSLIQSRRDKNESIGCRFVLEPAGRYAFDLPNNKNGPLLFKINNKSYTLAIDEVSLFLFETQIGLLVFSIQYLDKVNINEIVNCNYYLKQFFHRKVILVHKNNNLNRLGETHKTKLGTITKNLLRGLKVETFFEDQNGFPKNVLVYNGILLNSAVKDLTEHQKQIKEYLYRLSRTFRGSHLPTDTELDDDSETMWLFYNSYWRVALEGIAHVSFLVDNDETNRFFKEQNLANVRITYFYVYILALHQYFALQYFSILATRLPCNFKKKTSRPEKGEDIELSVNSLKKIMVLFTLRCSFKQVSNIMHITRLYEMIRKSLRIEDLMDELQMELDAITSIMELEEAKRKLKLERLILIFSFFFVLVSTGADGWAIVSNIDDFKMVTFWLAKLVAIVIISLMLLGIISIIKYFLVDNRMK